MTPALPSQSANISSQPALRPYTARRPATGVEIPLLYRPSALYMLEGRRKQDEKPTLSPHPMISFTLLLVREERLNWVAFNAALESGPSKFLSLLDAQTRCTLITLKLPDLNYIYFAYLYPTLRFLSHRLVCQRTSIIMMLSVPVSIRPILYRHAPLVRNAVGKENVGIPRVLQRFKSIYTGHVQPYMARPILILSFWTNRISDLHCILSNQFQLFSIENNNWFLNHTVLPYSTTQSIM